MSLHDRELKGLVAAMKLEATAKFSEVLDIVKSKELWRTAKCLVELSAPAMMACVWQTAILFQVLVSFIMKCSRHQKFLSQSQIRWLCLYPDSNT
jgi:hypothetical protein